MSISGLGSDNSLIAQATAAAPLIDRPQHDVPPQAYFGGSAIFHYLGPSFAVLLFARVDVLGVAWLRIASAALVFAVWRRPWRKLAALDRQGQLLIVSLGAVFAVMNAGLFTAYIVLAHRVARRSSMGGVDGLAAAMMFALVFVSPIGLADA